MSRQKAADDSPGRRDQELVSEHSELQDLEREFDELLAHMQTTKAAAAVNALFEMDSDELGAAAARTARTRDQ